ncbi:unnamed protein product [Cladocopium goreaui]|uniref:E3 ubiquitin-protein ligase HERC2 n=1 Tax=Cladocopium goreaui TaxID=2562237 RepID=A0A9P1FYG9_9DINO|nr:unnamed protein product [Cladocopium goreaui]
MRRLLRNGIWQPRCASSKAWPSLAVLAVDAESEVVQQIQQMKPQQVMLETCDQRMSFAAQEKTGKDAEVLSHVDAIAFVHGGLRSAQLRGLRKAAEEVGAQVYCVDRSYRETQNRVAKRLLMHPKEIVGFARSSLVSLGSQQVPANDAERCPEAVEKILGEEREEHMASEILRRHVSGAQCLVLCCPARREALERRLAQPEAESAIPAVATSRIWPFLLVLVYVVIPGYGTTFIFWRLAKGLGAAICGETAETLPPASVKPDDALGELRVARAKKSGATRGAQQRTEINGDPGWVLHLKLVVADYDMKQKALGNTQLVHVMKDKFAASRDALSHTPQVKQAMMIRWEAACHQAGGKEVVLGAAAAGGTGGLCLGALLFSGESSASAQQRLAETLQAAQQRNRTGLIRAKLRRGFRKRLILVSASSAAAAAYLCTLPTAMEGGFGPMAQLSGLARRLGRSGSAFGRTMCGDTEGNQFGRGMWMFISSGQVMVND